MIPFILLLGNIFFQSSRGGSSGVSAAPARAVCLAVMLTIAARSATTAQRCVGLAAGAVALGLICCPNFFLPAVLPWQALPTEGVLELLAPERLAPQRRGVNPPGGPGEGQPWTQALHIDLVVVSDRELCAEVKMRILSGRRMPISPVHLGSPSPLRVPIVADRANSDQYGNQAPECIYTIR